MAFELDHLFICTAINAPEADRLVALGFTEGTPSTHPGQGTANRRFFFHNIKLELIWVDRPEEAQSPLIAPTYLWQRWLQRNHICPFGICLRSTDRSGAVPPFPTWNYQPPYLPPAMSIPVATNAALLTEPMLFCSPFGQRPDAYTGTKVQPLTHALGLREVTRVTIVSPSASQPSAELQALVHAGWIALRQGSEYRLELGFDGELQGQQMDLRPVLPLLFCW